MENEEITIDEIFDLVQERLGEKEISEEELEELIKKVLLEMKLITTEG